MIIAAVVAPVGMWLGDYVHGRDPPCQVSGLGTVRSQLLRGGPAFLVADARLGPLIPCLRSKPTQPGTGTAQATTGIHVGLHGHQGSYVAEMRGEQKTIYVRASDVPIWRRAEAFARRRRLTVSALVINALEAYLAEHDDE